MTDTRERFIFALGGNMKKLSSIGAGLATLVTAAVCYAIPQVSGAAFVGASAPDTDVVFRTSGYVYNPSFSNALVTGSLPLDAADLSPSCVYYIRGNGLFLNISQHARNVVTRSVTTTTNGTSFNGNTTLGIAPGLPSGNTYFFGATVSLPPLNGGVSSALHGVTCQ